jgi:hypothetical protein
MQRARHCNEPPGPSRSKRAPLRALSPRFVLKPAIFRRRGGRVRRKRPTARSLAASDVCFLALAETVPEDHFAGYLGHLDFVNHGRFDAMLGHAHLLRLVDPSDPFALGMLSFALEDAGAADLAGDAALAATIPAAAREARHAVGAPGKSDISAHYVTKSAPRPNSLHPDERSGTCAVQRWHCGLRDTAPWCGG